MVLMAGSSALIAPLLLSALMPVVAGNEELKINVGKMLGALLLTQFLPLSIGLAIRSRRPALADRLARPARLVSLMLNLALLILILSVQFPTLAEIRPRAWFGMLALVFSTAVSGWLAGGPGPDRRKTFAITTSVRNVGLCLVIVTASFPGTLAVTAATAYGLFQTITLALAAWAWGKRSQAVAGTPAALAAGTSR
jgi:BASS family bile acid:Na+ symporter